ncbi:pentapeptide repeat-containing protein [Streptosporangium sp. KLBMP 9127]|nr:pentapeptide repeat-containing protein [Streptosporangium sp. KLBMP 9127]
MPSRTSPSRPQRQKEPIAPKLAATLAPATFPEHDLDDDGSYRSLEFRSADLSNRRADGPDFEGCRFVDTSFTGTTLRRAGFTGAELERCDMSNMAARSSTMHRSRVSSSRLTGMAWSECGFRDVTFDSCRADLTGFRFSDFKDVVFRDCNLTEANFQNADLRGVRFERCDLSGAQFSNAKMDGARFADCVLLGIASVTSLRGVTIKSQDAQGLVYALAAAMGITIED